MPLACNSPMRAATCEAEDDQSAKQNNRSRRVWNQRHEICSKTDAEAFKWYASALNSIIAKSSRGARPTPRASDHAEPHSSSKQSAEKSADEARMAPLATKMSRRPRFSCSID